MGLAAGFVFRGEKVSGVMLRIGKENEYGITYHMHSR